MSQFRAFSPNLKVNGESVLVILKGMGTFKIYAEKILAERGLTSPQAGKWYSKQAFLDAFQLISEKLGPHTMFVIGKEIPNNSLFPPQIQSVEGALSMLDKAYHMNHMGGDIGYYRFKKTGVKEGVMECKNPYPCDFDRGLIEGTAKKFKSKDDGFIRVIHDNSGPCRKRGEDSCLYHIHW